MHVYCPKCGQHGSATFEKNANSIHPRRSGDDAEDILSGVSAGFLKLGNEIRCAKCNVPARAAT